jgi:molybdopterin converting factor small subunit
MLLESRRKKPSRGISSDRQVPRKPRPVGGVKGHNKNEISFPGSPGLWPGSFTIFEGKPFSPMILIINVFGTEFVLKRPITLDLESATLRDVLIALQRHHEGPWKRILKEDLSLQEGYVVLVNGRNIASLEKLETSIHDGDEITFTVLVAGG